METEQDLRKLSQEYQKDMKPNNSEIQEEFKMPEKDSEEFKIIDYNAQNESYELGKDVFFKLNPEYSGKGHVPVNIDKNNILSIETFKPETQTKAQQGGFETREKPLGFVEISKSNDKESINFQNEKYFNTMESLIKKYEKSIKENPNSKQELQLNQLKKQLESYGREMLGYRDSDSVKESSIPDKKYEIGIKALLASGSKNELASFYYHKLNSKEEVDFVEKAFKDNGIKNIEQFFSQEESVKKEILSKDIDILKKPKKEIKYEDIEKLIVDTGGYIAHATNHTKEIFESGGIFSAYALNVREGKDPRDYRSLNAPKDGIFFDTNNIYQDDSFFQDYDSSKTRDRNSMENKGYIRNQSIAFISSRALITSHMKETDGNSNEVVYTGNSNDFNDESHKLDIDLGLFFIPDDKIVDKKTGYVTGWNENNIQELKNKIENPTHPIDRLNKNENIKRLKDVQEKFTTSKEYWDQYFTNLVKEGKQMPDISKIIFYKGDLSEAVFDHFKQKGMPSSPKSREKYNNLLVKEADKIRQEKIGDNI